jgi:hypothetical protein
MAILCEYLHPYMFRRFGGWLDVVEANFDDRNIVVTLDFHHDQVAFAEMAREFIQRHATKTRAEWRAEILEGHQGQADASGDAVMT